MANQDRFRVYRIDKDGKEKRQDMIVGHPERGWVCATETTDKRARQWAHTFSSSDPVNTYEIREIATDPESEDGSSSFREVTILRFRKGKGFV